MRRALVLAAGLLAFAPAQADALEAGTSKGRSCTVDTPGSIGGGSATYAVEVEESSCNPGIRVVTSLIYLTHHGDGVTDSSQRLRGGLDHTNQKSRMVIGTGYSSHHEFNVVLTKGRSRHPEHWKKGLAPNRCRVASTFFHRDTLVCRVENDLN